MCTPGYYCPMNATDQIICPAGSYCPPGSEQPIKCTAGSSCPKGSMNEPILLPFALLIVVDVLLIVLLLFLGFRARRALSRKGHQSSLPKRNKTKVFPGFKERTAGYKSLEDDAEMLPLEATIAPFRRAPTGFQAAYDAAYEAQYMSDNVAKQGIDIDSTVELRRFVDSMKKAVQVSSFGLSFAFSQLSFHPKGSTKPILSQISGSIPSGSLTGVMGGSGAGKCRSFSLQPSVYLLTFISNFRECPHGKSYKHRRVCQGKWRSREDEAVSLHVLNSNSSFLPTRLSFNVF